MTDLLKKIFIPAVLLLLTGWPAPAQKKIITITKEELAAKAVREEVLRSRVSFLADSICGGRAAGDNSAAAMGIYGAMEHVGLLPLGGSLVRSFTLENGKTCHDIIGMMPGSAKSPKSSYVLVTAYYDGLGVLDGSLYPGADNNASGVAALLSMAEMMRSMLKIDESYRRSVIFAALDAKYESMGGSRALWDLLNSGELADPLSGRTIRPSDIGLVLNIDQIGGTESPLTQGRSNYLIMLGTTPFQRSLAAFVNSRADLGLGLDLGFDYYGSRDFTRIFYNTYGDQKVFLEHGIPAVMVTSGITMRNNKLTDTPDSIDYGVLKKRICFLFWWLERIL